MVKTAEESGPASSGDMLASMEIGQEETLRAWKRACSLYAKYFSDLAGADSPGALMQANAEFMAGSMEALGRNAAGFLNLNSASQPQKH